MPAEARLPGRLMVVLGALYFAQGLPAGMLARSLPAIARDAGLPVEYIGLLALPAAPWVLKFLWSPWVDRLGAGGPDHRKRWILGAQVLAVPVLLCVGALDPGWLFGPGLWILLVCLFLLNLCFATHDIASDGLAVRLLPESWRGPGNALQSGGYKLGMLAGGAGLLVVGGLLGWRAAFWLLAAAMLALLVPVWRCPEPPEPRLAAAGRGRWWWREFGGFWLRPGMGVWLILLLGYRLGDSFGSRMLKPWLVDTGWRLDQIGTLDLVASAAGIVGAVTGGLLLLRLGRVFALVSFGLLQALGLLAFAAVARGLLENVLAVAVFEQFADGLSTVALFTMMMDRCRPGHEGVDYTLQACLVLASAGVVTLASGFSASLLGYPAHFALSAALSAVAIMPAIFWKRVPHA